MELESKVSMTVDCASQFVAQGDLGTVDVMVFCAFGLSTAAVSVLGVPDSGAPTLSPNAHGSIRVIMEYHPAEGASGTFNYTLALKPNVDGIQWSSDTTIRGQFGANRSETFDTELHFNVSANPGVTAASIPFVYWHDTGSALHRDVLAFNISRAATPGPGPLAVLGALAAVVYVARRRTL